MNYRIYRSLLQDRSLTRSQKLILSVMFSRRNEKYYREDLSEYTGIPLHILSNQLISIGSSAYIECTVEPEDRPPVQQPLSWMASYTVQQPDGPYYTLDDLVASDRSLKPADKLLYAYLSEHKTQLPDRNTLRNDTGMLVDTVRESLIRLLDRGLIKVSRTVSGKAVYELTCIDDVYSIRIWG